MIDRDELLKHISIHALREEGDGRKEGLHRAEHISIHALREEGDRGAAQRNRMEEYFYPRPPRGGRPVWDDIVRMRTLFLSTPSARRATIICRVLCK